MFPLKAFKEEGSGGCFQQSEGASTHPAGLCDKQESAETVPSLLPSPSLSLLAVIPSLLALLKEAKIESQNSEQPNNEQVLVTREA